MHSLLFLACVAVVLRFTTVQADVCGSILRNAPNDTYLLSGWDLMCYLENSDTDYLSTTCRDLIQDLPAVGNYSALLSKGGNFGCSLTQRDDFLNAETACFNDYQHTLILGSCSSCTRLYVCIRYPEIDSESSTSISPLDTTTVFQDSFECGSVLHTAPAEAITHPGWDLLCYITVEDTDYLKTQCRYLIQDLPPDITDYTTLLAQGGNFGCLVSPRDDFIGGANACEDQYQPSLTLGSCGSCRRLFVCIRFAQNATESSTTTGSTQTPSTLTSSTTLQETETTPSEAVSTSETPVTACGSILHVAPNDTAVIDGWGPICYIDRTDSAHLQTPCQELIQRLPDIGDYNALLDKGGNFGCALSTRSDFSGATNACYDGYQQSTTLSVCTACPKLFVCIRLPPNSNN